MKPFLRQVAEAYVANEAENLMDYCFVFPNKRSATFFSSFLSPTETTDMIAPETMTITDFVASFSPLVEANRYEQLFTLYTAYSRQPDVDIDFDRFLFWGEMLINDFNDVDRYLVDPEALFVNIKRLREISANYLSKEQLAVIERFWGEQSPHQHVEHFWNHLDYGDSAARSKFIKLWEVLLPLYNEFNTRLSQRGLSSSGMLYRKAVEALTDDSAATLPYSRYIFVGFNVLSISEIAIFSRLQKRGMADFYWDFNSPALRIPDNRARRFIARNIAEFPSRYRLEEQPIETIPNIRVVGVPSAIGQVKAAAQQITQWIDNSTIADTANAIDTAVVLPDESLFIPLIHSMPEAITDLNITMGFPLKLSPVASLLKTIVRLQLRTRTPREAKPTFFYEDVKPLLASPLIVKADPEGCRRLEAEIRRRRMFQIPAEEIAELAPGITPVFRPIGNLADIDAVRGYIAELCDFLARNLPETDRMNRHFITAYRAAVDRLCEAASDFGIRLTGFSLFQMVERTVNSDKVNFEGTPLSGLQVMGVLETRALDFDNVIMLSMNERVFPRKHYSRSFIPDALRRGYGMATLDFQESIFAYYFYRLLSRARNVTLIYDARRVGGSRSNEMSRYLAQLLYIFGNENITHTLGIYHTMPFETHPVTVAKDRRIMELLKQFTTDGTVKRNLSASALNTYINCPLEFYLRYVEGLDAEEEITDYMDFSTFGTVLHEVMERYYTRFQPVDPADGSRKPVTITEEMLEPTINNPDSLELDKLITATINRCFNHYPEPLQMTPLAGETLVMGRIFKHTVIEMLKVDRAETPFTFVAAEYPMEGALRIDDNLSVNVRQIIDRIDIDRSGNMRFVDYKTGNDTIDASSVADLFNGANPKRAKALMQLMLYCHIYRTLKEDTRPITPVVYKMRTLLTEGVRLSGIGPGRQRHTVMDYNDFHDEFAECLNAKIAEIFDPEVPFTQAATTHSCKFCNFKTICSVDEQD